MKTQDEFRRQVNELWSQAVGQLEEVKDIIVRSRDKLETDVQKLRAERDRLLIKLGEQTYRLVNQGQLPVPAFLRRTIEKLNDVIDIIVEHDDGAPKKASESGRARSGQGPRKKPTKKRAATPSVGREKVAKKAATRSKPRVAKKKVTKKR